MGHDPSPEGLMATLIRGREVIALLSGAATWPLAVRAQRVLPAIGFLHEGLPEPSHLTAAFGQGLMAAGIRGGRDVTSEHGGAEGEYAGLRALGADLIVNRVGFIAAAYLVAARAAKAATQTVPIVFVTGSDPVAADLVPSLNRPTGNLTGVAFMFTQLGPKNLEILHELVPNAFVIGALVNPNNPNAEPQLRDLQASAHMLGLRLVTFAARSVSEIDSVFATLPEHKIEAMLVTADGFFFGLQDELVPRAARHAVPTVFPLSDYVAAGGLVCYLSHRFRASRPTRRDAGMSG